MRLGEVIGLVILPAVGAHQVAGQRMSEFAWHINDAPNTTDHPIASIKEQVHHSRRETGLGFEELFGPDHWTTQERNIPPSTEPPAAHMTLVKVRPWTIVTVYPKPPLHQVPPMLSVVTTPLSN
ncbi:hypothetical protein B0T17DRAFT_512412 [Bombardia bombarda]|uniref:Secreted protein n=1 Tax=Bombardia bombarda TaxID=252184 RepID=A0AA39TR85_9PEZI|nr:hypothetical protein B0T17DRAFT_512412 [Bombardia bombarda]